MTELTDTSRQRIDEAKRRLEDRAAQLAGEESWGELSVVLELKGGQVKGYRVTEDCSHK